MPTYPRTTVVGRGVSAMSPFTVEVSDTETMRLSSW